MIILSDKKNCCGCNGCVQTCPVQCISMKIDDEGFWYPLTDEDRCIHCNKCNKVCPIENSSRININKPEEVKTFICYSKNESNRQNSSSGGIFYELANWVLKSDGVVFGAVFADDFFVKFIEIDRLERLPLMQGSKYLQANVENTFKQAESLLKTGKLVLFSATPCYIAGLKAFLQKEYSNLILVDILCHGVPSPKVWKRYLDEKRNENGSDIKYIYFRNKENGWHNYAVKIDFENTRTYNIVHSQDDYMKIFLSNVCLRPCCYECHFKGMNRPSDISLGDCWGVEKSSPEMDDNRGTSVALIHTRKGEEFFNCIMSNLTCKETNLDDALPPTAHSRISVKAHRNRKKFFINLNKGQPIKKLTKLIEITIFKRVARKFKSILFN